MHFDVYTEPSEEEKEEQIVEKNQKKKMNRQKKIRIDYEMQFETIKKTW